MAFTRLFFIKNTNNMKALTLCLLSLCLFLGKDLRAQTVKGTNVKRVVYKATSQNGAGSFENSSGKTWVEYKQAKGRTVHAQFTETGRDEWSVYMKKSDGATIQLDLWRKKIRLMVQIFTT